MKQSLTFDNFSGGITDYYLGGSKNAYEKADNFIIVKYGTIGRLYTRPGSVIYNNTCYRVPGNTRIGTLINFEVELLIHTVRKLHYVDSVPLWQTIQGPTSNELFPSGVDASVRTSYATWNRHL